VLLYVLITFLKSVVAIKKAVRWTALAWHWYELPDLGLIPPGEGENARGGGVHAHVVEHACGGPDGVGVRVHKIRHSKELVEDEVHGNGFSGRLQETNQEM
jgi:hypothetical protein